MNYVQPIRDLGKIDEIKQELLKSGYRNYLLFVLGINTGLRVGDLLDLKVHDVKDKTHITVIEEKTGKTNRIYINEKAREALTPFIKNMEASDFLFKGTKGPKPISRVQAYRILNAAAGQVGIREIGTHTMRKTFGYFHYQQYKDVAILQSLFNHSAPSVTLRYIGIDQDQRDLTMKGFSL